MKKEKKFFSRKAFSALIPTPLVAPVQQHAVLGAAFNMCLFIKELKEKEGYMRHVGDLLQGRQG